MNNLKLGFWGPKIPSPFTKDQNKSGLSALMEGIFVKKN